MSDYFKSLEMDCVCGAKIKVTDHAGNGKWIDAQAEAFAKAHKECAAGKAPVVRIPAVVKTDA